MAFSGIFRKLRIMSSTMCLKELLIAVYGFNESTYNINNLLLWEGLPYVDYRISADYGRLEVVLTKTN